MEQNVIKVGDACLTAFGNLTDEIVRFKAAQLYFVRLEYAALRDKGLAQEAHDALLETLKPRYEKPSAYFLERSFILLVAAFELFLQDILTIIIKTNPKKVGQIEFKLSEILDSSGKEELIRRGIEGALNKLMYKKPFEYLSDITGLLSIDPTPLNEHWPSFIEAKARRDLGVHNGWKCNSIYLRKIHDAGLKTNYVEEESISPTDRAYFDAVSKSLTTLSDLIISQLIDKHGKSLHKTHIH